MPIGDSISFACAGDGTAPLVYQWRKDGAPIVGNASASTPTLTLSTVAGADAGNYDCVVANTAGSAVSRMAALAVVVPAAGVIVNHAPVLNGWLDGAVQVLLPESTTLNGSARVSGDLLIPGLPAVRLNGQPTFGGTLDASGSATPSNHTVTLNGGAQLGRVIRRVDGAALPALPAPPAPTGTRDVVINAPGQSAGDFATLRNLTLNGGAGDVAIAAGTYGTFTANSQSGIVLGVTGSATPAIYNLQGLTLNSGSSLRIAGPVIVTVAGSVIVNGSAAAGNGGSDPSLLHLNIASGGLTLNGGATFTGAVTAPAGTVIVNGTLNGRVIANRLIINGNGALHARE